MGKDLGSELYSGAATFGKIRAVIGVIFGTIFGIIFIVGGIVLIRKKVQLISQKMGTITNNPNCIKFDDKNDVQYRCTNIDVKYNVDNKDYTMNKSTYGPFEYKQGNQIDVYYDPNDPFNAELQSDNKHIIGWIGLVSGIFIFIGSWFWLWMTWHYKFVAAAGGVAGVVDIFDR